MMQWHSGKTAGRYIMSSADVGDVTSNDVSTLFKHVRCNPDVAPRLTSGGYEDKVDVNTPINILFIGVANFDPL